MRYFTLVVLCLSAFVGFGAENVPPGNSVPAPEIPQGPGEASSAADREQEATVPEAAAAQEAVPARYQAITDRMPFGTEPEGFDPENPTKGGPGGRGADGALTPEQEAQLQSEEAQKIIASVRVSMLNVTPSGKIAIGFTDNSAQPAANYYLKVGESRDGWTVKDADAREQVVTLVKDGVEAELKLGEGSDGKGGKGEKGGKGPRLTGRAAAGANAAAQAPAAPAASSLAELRGRRARRQAAMQAEVQAAQAKAAALEQEKKDREAERAAEREQAAAEREQQRQALLQIQEDLRRQREERQKAEAEKSDEGEKPGAEGESQE